MPKRDKTLQVEALTYSDSFDSLVDRHFRARSLHRAEDAGPYDVSRIVEKFGNKLIRSRQEYLPAPSGFSTHLEWASACFQLENDVFVTMMAKGNSLVRSRTGEDEYKIAVTADSPKKAASVLSKLRREFLSHADKQGAAFFIMTGGRRATTCASGNQTSIGCPPTLIALRRGFSRVGG